MLPIVYSNSKIPPQFPFSLLSSCVNLPNFLSLLKTSWTRYSYPQLALIPSYILLELRLLAFYLYIPVVELLVHALGSFLFYSSPPCERKEINFNKGQARGTSDPLFSSKRSCITLATTISSTAIATSPSASLDSSIYRPLSLRHFRPTANCPRIHDI